MGGSQGSGVFLQLRPIIFLSCLGNNLTSNRHVPNISFVSQIRQGYGKSYDRHENKHCYAVWENRRASLGSDEPGSDCNLNACRLSKSSPVHYANAGSKFVRAKIVEWRVMASDVR